MTPSSIQLSLVQYVQFGGTNLVVSINVSEVYRLAINSASTSKQRETGLIRSNRMKSEQANHQV